MQDDLGSISRAIAGFEGMEEEAAKILWERFFERLTRYASQNIYKRHRRFFDGEDIAGSAMFALLDGLKKGKFEKVNNRDQLWQILTTIAARKTINRGQFHDREKRGGGKVRGSSAIQKGQETANLIKYISRLDDDPAKFVELEMTCEELLTALPDDGYRQITLMRLAGLSNQEISNQVGCSTRTIDRKIRAIELIWIELESSWRTDS
jgi:RNA polymerase sigma factor (sigma-70 family)